MIFEVKNKEGYQVAINSHWLLTIEDLGAKGCKITWRDDGAHISALETPMLYAEVLVAYWKAQ